MRRFDRQQPFLKSLLQEADHQERKEKLLHANKDQINAVSELVLNVLKRNVPTTSHVVRQLSPYKTALRALTKRRHSVKQRRNILQAQTGGGFWKGLNQCFSQACRLNSK